MHAVVVDVQVSPAPLLTVYPVTGLPFAAAAVHDTVAWPLVVTAVTPVGADGGPAGTAWTDGDGCDGPATLIATTEKA